METDAVELCCLLWARDGERAGLSAYEDRVLALVADHGGQIVQRARSRDAGNGPDEVQLFRFEEDAALQAYLADPRRLALAGERDRVVARTELFPVSIGEQLQHAAGRELRSAAAPSIASAPR